MSVEIGQFMKSLVPSSPVREPERSTPPVFQHTAVLVGEFVGVQATRESIDKALDDVKRLKAELDNVCLNLSSLRDGGSNVSAAEIKRYEQRADEIELSISDRMTAIDEAEAALKNNAAT